MLTLKEYPVLFANCSFQDFKGRDLGEVVAFDPETKTATTAPKGYLMTNIQFTVDPEAMESILAEHPELEEFFGTPVVEQLEDEVVGDEAENEVYDEYADENATEEEDDEDWEDEDDDED